MGANVWILVFTVSGNVKLPQSFVVNKPYQVMHSCIFSHYSRIPACLNSWCGYSSVENVERPGNWDRLWRCIQYVSQELVKICSMFGMCYQTELIDCELLKCNCTTDCLNSSLVYAFKITFSKRTRLKYAHGKVHFLCFYCNKSCKENHF